MSHRSHFIPRTRAGRIAAAALLALFILAEPPVVHAVANRVEPWVLGTPFLFFYLLVIYAAMIAVLLWMLRRGV